MVVKATENLIHEYPAIDKYRVRVLQKDAGRGRVVSFDVREYVDAEKFQGFTRKGVRLSSREQVAALRDALTDMLDRGWFEGAATA